MLAYQLYWQLISNDWVSGQGQIALQSEFRHSRIPSLCVSSGSRVCCFSVPSSKVSGLKDVLTHVSQPVAYFETVPHPRTAGVVVSAALSVTDTVLDVDNGWKSIPFRLYNNQLSVSSLNRLLAVHNVKVAKVSGAPVSMNKQGLTQETYQPTLDNPIRIEPQMLPGMCLHLVLQQAHGHIRACAPCLVTSPCGLQLSVVFV